MFLARVHDLYDDHYVKAGDPGPPTEVIEEPPYADDDPANPGFDPLISNYSWSIASQQSYTPIGSANPPSIPIDVSIDASYFIGLNYLYYAGAVLEYNPDWWVPRGVLNDLNWNTGYSNVIGENNYPWRIKFNTPIDLRNILVFASQDFRYDVDILSLRFSIMVVNQSYESRVFNSDDYFIKRHEDPETSDHTISVVRKFEHVSDPSILIMKNVTDVIFFSIVDGMVGLKDIAFNIDSYSLT